MKEYAALTELGIVNPEQIARYTYHTLQGTDALRIIYQRKKGSLLPVSKTFKFPKVKKSVLVDGGSRKTEVVYESVQIFQKVLLELEDVLGQNKNKEALNQILEDEIIQLEAEVASRIDYIKSLVKNNK